MNTRASSTFVENEVVEEELPGVTPRQNRIAFGSMLVVVLAIGVVLIGSYFLTPLR
jgi:hypothetical protein